MKTLCVNLADQRSYPIHIGANLIDKLGDYADYFGSSAAIVTNDTVARLYLQRLLDSLRSIGVDTTVVVLPDGEKHKDWPSLNATHDRLMEAGCDRSSPIIALGGGVIGDLAGFAAATYRRGVPFVQIPTTLLAQVDSAVGGKTGINHRLGKNMIGCFWQPSLVLADLETLQTLAPRELSAGLAEVIKYGLIGDQAFFEWLEDNIEKLRQLDFAALTYAIGRSCANKAAIVVADERENAAVGGRALLNLGHTFGHAIENSMGYGTYLHGEAVAVGIMMAATLSQLYCDSLDDVALDRIRRILIKAGLPVSAPATDIQQFTDLMRNDKKNRRGQLRLILLKSIGEAVICPDVPGPYIREVIATYCCD